MKNKKLVVSGPYSVTRNPLYFSSMLMIIGICLVFGSLVATTLFSVLSFLIFNYTAKQEAVYLQSNFGESYRDYAARTPLFWPDLSRFEWGLPPAPSRNTVYITFRDSLIALALIPLSELVEYLREGGFVPLAFHVF